MPTIEMLLKDLDALEMRLPAVVEPKYSNLGIAILGHALSRVAGRSYDDYVHQNILKPLGMTSTGFNRADYSEERLALPYYMKKGEYHLAPMWDEQGFRPAGGMYSTVKDMARFISLQFRDGPPGGDMILGGTSLREMHAPALVSSDFEMGFGLGWGIRRIGGHKVIGHSGGLPGYTTNISLVPDMKLAVIVFTNTGTVPVEISNALLEKILIPTFGREAVRQQPQPTPEELETLKPYTGRYAWLDDDAIELKVVKGKLRLLDPDLPAGMDIWFEPHEGHTFKIKGGPHHSDFAAFEADASGKITGMMLAGYPLERVD